MMITWESAGDFIIASPGDSSQSNDFSPESSNDVNLRVLMRRMTEIYQILVNGSICNTFGCLQHEIDVA